jgi:hypothetical protein
MAVYVTLSQYDAVMESSETALLPMVWAKAEAVKSKFSRRGSGGAITIRDRPIPAKYSAMALLMNARVASMRRS